MPIDKLPEKHNTAHPTRKDWGLSQDDFGRRLGMSQSAWSRIENGRGVPKPVRMLIELAEGRATPADIKSGALAASITEE